jgi:pimeloyl-ACP methyl ester carboxylesterase
MRFLDFDGEREPPLVFVHGLGGAGSAHFPRLLAEPAFAGHRLVAMDLLGHGYSDRPAEFDYSLQGHAETVAQLLDHLRLRVRGVRAQHGRLGRDHARCTTAGAGLAAHAR